MQEIQRLIRRYPQLGICCESIEQAVHMMISLYERGGKALVCGNGGSCADAEHIVGELMKGFCRERPLVAQWKGILEEFGEEGNRLANALQMALPAISLSGLPALSSAFANDVDPKYVYAQQAFALAEEGDLFIGISTSGNAKNILAGALAAKAKGAVLLGLTGSDGGGMNGLFDCLIKVPEQETYKVQELHLPTYHAICLEVENHFFKV